MIAVAGLAIIAAVFSLFLKSYRKEYSFFLILGATAVILLLALPQLSKLLALISSFASSAALTEHLQPVIKALGIALITQIGADICRDCGEQSLATKVEFSGKIAILLLTVPLLQELLILITRILN